MPRTPAMIRRRLHAAAAVVPWVAADMSAGAKTSASSVESPLRGLSRGARNDLVSDRAPHHVRRRQGGTVSAHRPNERPPRGVDERDPVEVDPERAGSVRREQRLPQETPRPPSRRTGVLQVSVGPCGRLVAAMQRPRPAGNRCAVASIHAWLDRRTSADDRPICRRMRNLGSRLALRRGRGGCRACACGTGASSRAEPRGARGPPSRRRSRAACEMASRSVASSVGPSAACPLPVRSAQGPGAGRGRNPPAAFQLPFPVLVPHIAAIVSAGMRSMRLFKRRATRCTQVRTRSGMSSGRSRSGGSTIGKTFRR